MPGETATQRLLLMCRPAASGAPKIGLDTCCVQYYISNPPVQPWADCLDPIFQAGLSGQAELYVSSVVVSELLAHVHFASRQNSGYDPELDLLAILNRHFRVLNVDGDIARAAGRLRGHYAPGDKIALKTPDALIGATSIHHNHTLFVTNDAQLADALPAENCIYLRDLALEWLAERFPRACLAGPNPVQFKGRGPGLPDHPPQASSELASIRPDPAAKPDRILADCLKVAATVNEPCAFFILQRKTGRKVVAEEVIFWQPALADSRPAQRIVARLRNHVAPAQGQPSAAAAGDPSLCAMFTTSLSRARARQAQLCFNSRSDADKEFEAWREYLGLFWTFREALSLPNTTWVFCEDGQARPLKPDDTATFIRQAGNVLGWEGTR